MVALRPLGASQGVCWLFWGSYASNLARLSRELPLHGCSPTYSALLRGVARKAPGGWGLRGQCTGRGGPGWQKGLTVSQPWSVGAPRSVLSWGARPGPPRRALHPTRITGHTEGFHPPHQLAPCYYLGMALRARRRIMTPITWRCSHPPRRWCSTPPGAGGWGCGTPKLVLKPEKAQKTTEFRECVRG